MWYVWEVRGSEVLCAYNQKIKRYFLSPNVQGKQCYNYSKTWIYQFILKKKRERFFLTGGEGTCMEGAGRIHK